RSTARVEVSIEPAGASEFLYELGEAGLGPIDLCPAGRVQPFTRRRRKVQRMAEHGVVHPEVKQFPATLVLREFLRPRRRRKFVKGAEIGLIEIGADCPQG